MRVDVISNLTDFGKLESNWNALYDADPDAQLFISWKWLSGWLTQISSPWFVLAAKPEGKPDAPYVAFLPMRIQTKSDNGRIHNELNMAGNFTADYTGFLCEPGAEHLAIPAFVRHLKQLNWSRLNFENFRISEPRMRLFLAHFPKANFQTSETSRIGKTDGIDNALCPFAVLPPSWDGYLEGLSTNTRQKIRRLLRMVDASEEYRITVSTTETIERDLNTLLEFWEIKWKPRKGDLVHTLVRSNRAMLTRSFRSGLLYLPTLWQGERPLAALATLMDMRKRSFLFYITGRDETFDGPPPGVILHAHSIRHAIANGITEYDFLRGNETYKYSFGVKERRIRCTVVATRNGLNLGGKVDPRTIPDVLDEATKFHQQGKLIEAERGYRDVLQVQPKNADAIHRLGQLSTTRGDHAAAKRHYKTLTTIRPEAYKAWLCLAQSCKALDQHLEAANAYREVLRLKPDLPEVFSDLAGVLIKLNRMAEVNAALVAALGTQERAPKKNGKVQAKRVMHRSNSRDEAVAM
ncbi:cellulose biosynthesis protein [Bradyrhizobiaceae bacterium SG-6C]|nr:cellulose biosynthesis protein [Bradyrhizobiaceae bacterium SG-6C]